MCTTRHRFLPSRRPGPCLVESGHARVHSGKVLPLRARFDVIAGLRCAAILNCCLYPAPTMAAPTSESIDKKVETTEIQETTKGRTYVARCVLQRALAKICGSCAGRRLLGWRSFSRPTQTPATRNDRMAKMRSRMSKMKKSWKICQTTQR